MLDEFRVAMFLCGCANIQDLRNAPVVVTGWTLEYPGQRGFNVKDYALAGDAFKAKCRYLVTFTCSQY